MQKLRIIVGGFIGLLPSGGISWDYAQYPVGLAELGHDVFYIEDTRQFPLYLKQSSDWSDASFCVEYLRTVMNFFGMSDRWAYRDEASGTCFGMSAQEVLEIVRTADVFINISCSTVMRDEYRRIPVRVLIDSDPIFTQIQYLTKQRLAPGQISTRSLVDAHNYHFTFGENYGTPKCQIPLCGIEWHRTRQPICLGYWNATTPNTNARFTTLMNWAASKALIYDGKEWGQKDIEFKRFINLPAAVPDASFAIAVGQARNTGIDDFPAEQIQKNGWVVLDPEHRAGDLVSYQEFIKNSLGEFSVAKQTYVQGRTGWFSCRSACYLASGRPVITQDTGWSRNIPTGRGLFAFEDLEGAIDAIEKVNLDPLRHSRYARRIAEEFFDSRMVLSDLLAQLK